MLDISISFVTVSAFFEALIPLDHQGDACSQSKMYKESILDCFKLLLRYQWALCGLGQHANRNGAQGCPCPFCGASLVRMFSWRVCIIQFPETTSFVFHMHWKLFALEAFSIGEAVSCLDNKKTRNLLCNMGNFAIGWKKLFLQWIRRRHQSSQPQVNGTEWWMWDLCIYIIIDKKECGGIKPLLH